MESIESSGHRVQIRDLYTSLCVLTNQVCVTVSVLGRMWKLDEKLACDIAKLFCEMSLATLSWKSGNDVVEKSGLNLHHLHLDFCKQEAELNNSHSLWNSALLNGHLEPPLNISLPEV